MVHTHSNRRLTFFLALGVAAMGALTAATPANAQGGRFRVLVPTLERQGDVDDDFGKDVAEEVRELIDELPTHAPVEKGELKTALKQYKLDEDDLNCVKARQLSVQRGFELVMCGKYSAAPGGMQVSASFISAKSGETFEVPAITARDPKQAAQHIFSSFDRYVNQIRLTKFCMDDLETQQYQAALKKCEEALAVNPNSQAALYGKGYALMKMDELEPAAGALRKVLDLNPVYQDALLAMGFVMAKLNRREESLGYYNQYLELNPSDPTVRVTVATEAAKAGDAESALQICEAGVKEGDDSPNGLTLIEYCGYFAMAAAAKLEEPSKGQNAGPQRSPQALALYEKALGYFERVFAAKGSEVQPNLLVSKVNTLVQLGRAAEAVEFGKRAVAAKAGEADVWSAYSSALKEAGKVDEALAALDSTLARNPKAENIRSRQGLWLLQAGQLEKSKAAFRQAIERRELDSDAVARTIFSTGYNDKYQKKQHDEALPYFDLAREFATGAQTKGMVSFWTGFILYNKGMKVQEPSTLASAKQALPLFQKALEYFQQSGAYAETQPSIKLAQFVDGSKTYIEIQEALIKRGR